jgi:hypothetical protein
VGAPRSDTPVTWHTQLSATAAAVAASTIPHNERALLCAAGSALMSTGLCLVPRSSESGTANTIADAVVVSVGSAPVPDDGNVRGQFLGLDGAHRQ